MKVERPCTPVPRFAASHPAIFVTLAYVGLVVLAAIFLQVIGAAQGNPDDPRSTHAAIIFAVVAALPFHWALRRSYRRPRVHVGTAGNTARGTP